MRTQLKAKYHKTANQLADANDKRRTTVKLVLMLVQVGFNAHKS